VVVIGVAIVWLFWRQKTLPKQADDAWLASLPAENYQQPVVLVCGDGATPLFSGRSLRQVPAGLYLHVADEEQLVSLTESLLSRRPAWGTALRGTGGDTGSAPGRRGPGRATAAFFPKSDALTAQSGGEGAVDSLELPDCTSNGRTFTVVYLCWM
jgi:hypothetical protein